MKQVVLRSFPQGNPAPENFALVDAPMPEAGPGEILVKTLWLSLDPLIRFSMDDKRLTGVVHLQPGDVLYGGTVSRVIASNHADYPVGGLVEGRTGWREYAAVDPVGGDRVRGAMRKVDPALAPISTALGVLGMPGQTAHAAAVGIGRVQAGETVVISGAGGAVGSMAGQIGKILGARVVGIAGGPAKCAALRDIGFDAAVDYKATDFTAQLQAALPQGFDLYIDNVGGDVTLAVLPLANYRARMAMAGFIAYYGVGMDGPGPDHLPGFMRLIMSKALEVRGFSGPVVAGEAGLAELAGWVRKGQLAYREAVVEGLENAAAAFCETFSGVNDRVGKLLVRVASE
jgi:NADPH-dependent curcumin reductase CurA